MMRRYLVRLILSLNLLCIGGILILSCVGSQKDTLLLSGEWTFNMDDNDIGVEQKWNEREFTETIILPGSMATNGLGYRPGIDTHWTGTITELDFLTDSVNKKYLEEGNFKVPFWFIADTYYVGPAWYAKEVVVPEYWRDDVVELFIERSHFQTTVWVNGKYVGECNSLGTPHRFDITDALDTDRKCKIVCRVDNRLDKIDVGINSHSVTDHTQTNWNGMIGRIELRRIPSVHITDIQIFPDVKNKQAEVVVTLKNEGVEPFNDMLSLHAESGNGGEILDTLSEKVNVAAKTETQIKITYPMGDHPLLWDEFTPNLYTMQVKLGPIQNRAVTFGMREFSSSGRRFTVNDRPIMLRGTLECAIFPFTGYPSMDVQSWDKIFRKCKDYGLNHVRFHSWCPPEAAFVAADSLGIYLQVECGSWAANSVALGEGTPLDEYIYEESERIVREYGNHPSFCLMAYGNEPRGNHYEDFLAVFVRHWQAKGDTRRLYTTGSGWPVIDSVCDFNNTPRPRLQGTARKAEINKNRPSSTYNWNEIVTAWNKPTISHEIGQWCAYPDFTEIDKYTGVLKARNYEIFRDRLQEKGMEHLAEDFKMASGKLQLLCYKAEIEAALRTKELAGFQLLDLRDFPGQGTAPVGVLNTLWEEKGYATARDYSHFCNDLVPLALFPKMIYENDEILDVNIEVSNFAENTPKEVATWQIADSDGKIFASGELAAISGYGSCVPLGNITTTLTAITIPVELTLTVRVGKYENFWNFYVFPTLKNIPAGDVIICDHIDNKTMEALNQGTKVLLTLRKGTLKAEAGGDIRFGFSPIFWNTVWVNKDVPYTLGILCDPTHPALAGFPTSYHSNWQWWDASTHAQPINMEYIGKDIVPFVRAIDGWAEARSLGLMFEGKVGKGSLLVCAIDLLTDQEIRPEAKALIRSLLNYMNTDKFNPEELLDVFNLKR